MSVHWDCCTEKSSIHKHKALVMAKIESGMFLGLESCSKYVFVILEFKNLSSTLGCLTVELEHLIFCTKTFCDHVFFSFVTFHKRQYFIIVWLFKISFFCLKDVVPNEFQIIVEFKFIDVFYHTFLASEMIQNLFLPAGLV